VDPVGQNRATGRRDSLLFQGPHITSIRPEPESTSSLNRRISVVEVWVPESRLIPVVRHDAEARVGDGPMRPDREDQLADIAGKAGAAALWGEHSISEADTGRLGRDHGG
jgi:hypothetical protein